MLPFQSKPNGVLFAKIEKLILKFLLSLEGPQIAKTMYEKKNQVEESILPDFKT